MIVHLSNMNRFLGEFRAHRWTNSDRWICRHDIGQRARNLIAKDHHVWTVWPVWAPALPHAQFAMNRTARQPFTAWHCWTGIVKHVPTLFAQHAADSSRVKCPCVARKALLFGEIQKNHLGIRNTECLWVHTCMCFSAWLNVGTLACLFRI